MANNMRLTMLKIVVLLSLALAVESCNLIPNCKVCPAVNSGNVKCNNCNTGFVLSVNKEACVTACTAGQFNNAGAC